MNSEYRKLAAIDVHKRVLMVVVVGREAPEVVMAEERFLTARGELKKLAAWLEEQGVEEVVMESTAQYWWPVWVELEEQFALYLAQARSTKRRWGGRRTLGMRAGWHGGFPVGSCASASCRGCHSGRAAAGADVEESGRADCGDPP